MTDKEYYVGFDIGTDSVGMAATDTEYRVLKYKGKALWFVRLFDESMTAAERRGFRSGTRRLARKRERISLLQMMFNSPIAEKDVAFFQRLKESNLYEEDKTVGTPYAVFADADYTDKDYHRDFPTIYHLRKELIVNPEPHDVRLVYLALHHLIKHRGHFLFDSLNASGSNSFADIFKDLQTYLFDEYGIQINCDVPDALGDVLKDRKRTINAKFADGIKLCGINKKTDKRAAAVMALICGKSESASVLFDEEIIDENGKLLKIELKFTVLNELNNLRINGEKISVELKKDIFNDLFLRRKKVTQKGLTNYLKSLGYSDVEVTGVDGDFKSSMKPYIDLCEYGLSEDEMERIILAVTIFGDDKRLLKKRLKQELSNKLTDKEINKISHLQYSGWGRLSREFLCDIEAVNQALKAEYIVLGVGQRNAKLDIPGKEFLHGSREFLDIEEMPEHLICIGAGIISMEFASMALTLGKKVTFIEFAPRALAAYPEKYVNNLVEKMTAQGSDFHFNEAVCGVEKTNAFDV